MEVTKGCGDLESETTIAENLRNTYEKAQYDAACKRLLSEKIILAWIMKECLEEYKDYDVKEIAEKYIEGEPQVSTVPVMPDAAGTMIRGLNTEDTSLHEGTITYDIRFYAIVPNTNERIRLIINLEAQSDFYPGYPLPKRGVYYCSRMISSQYGTEFTASHYEKVKKVYSIWICMNPPKYRENTITRYSMAEFPIVGNVKEPVENYDLLSVIIICLGSSNGKRYDGILKLLDVLLSKTAEVDEKRQILQDDYDISMTQTLESEVSVMCNLSKGIEDRGIAKGIARGMEQGMSEGTAAAIKNLTETLGLPVEQAMNALKIPEADRPKYMQMLQSM